MTHNGIRPDRIKIVDHSERNNDLRITDQESTLRIDNMGQPAYPDSVQYRLRSNGDDMNVNWNAAKYSMVYYNYKDAVKVLAMHPEFIPRGMQMIKPPVNSKSVPLQVFVSTTMTRSLTHYDDTNSILYCVTGCKIVWLAQPDAHEVDNLSTWSGECSRGHERTKLAERRAFERRRERASPPSKEQ